LTEEIRNSRWLRRLIEDQTKGEEILSIIPQGPGSGLDADMVDGHHYSDFVELLLRIEKTSGPGSPITISAGGGGSGDMLKAVYDPNDDGIVKDADKIGGLTIAQVQDHAPKFHGNEVHTSTFITQGAIDTHATLPDVHHPQAHASAHEVDGADLVRPYLPVSGVWRIDGTSSPFNLQAEDLLMYVEGILRFDADTGKMKVSVS
jgi:hypothetical protein